MPFLTNKKLWSAALLSATLVACGGSDGGGSTNTSGTTNTNTTAQGLLSKALSTTDGLYDFSLNGFASKINGTLDQTLTRDGILLSKPVTFFNGTTIGEPVNIEMLLVKSNAEAKYTVQTDANGYVNEMTKILQDTNNQLTIADAQINGVNFGESRITYVAESLANKSLMSALGTDNLEQLDSVALPGNFGSGAEGYKLTKYEIVEGYASIAKALDSDKTSTMTNWEQAMVSQDCKKQPDITLNKRVLVAYDCAFDQEALQVATQVDGLLYTGGYYKSGFVDNTESWWINKTAADTLKTAIDTFNGLSGLVK